MQFRNLFLLAYGILAVQARAIPQMTRVNETIAISMTASIEPRTMRKSFLGKTLVCALVAQCAPMLTEIPHHTAIHREKKKLAEQRKKEEEIRKSVEHDYSAYNPADHECLPQSVKQGDGTFVTVPCKKAVANLERRDVQESAEIGTVEGHGANEEDAAEIQEHTNGTSPIKLNGETNDHNKDGNAAAAAAAATTAAVANIEARGLRRSKKIKAILCGILPLSCASLATEVSQDTKERIAQEHGKEGQEARKKALEGEGETEDFRVYDAANYKCLPELVKQEDGTFKIVPCRGKAAAAA